MSQNGCQLSDAWSKAGGMCCLVASSKAVYCPCRCQAAAAISPHQLAEQHSRPLLWRPGEQQWAAVQQLHNFLLLKAQASQVCRHRCRVIHPALLPHAGQLEHAVQYRLWPARQPHAVQQLASVHVRHGALH